MIHVRSQDDVWCSKVIWHKLFKGRALKWAIYVQYRTNTFSLNPPTKSHVDTYTLLFCLFFNTIYQIYYLFSRSKSPCAHVKIFEFLHLLGCQTCSWSATDSDFPRPVRSVKRSRFAATVFARSKPVNWGRSLPKMFMFLTEKTKTDVLHILVRTHLLVLTCQQSCMLLAIIDQICRKYSRMIWIIISVSSERTGTV